MRPFSKKNLASALVVPALFLASCKTPPSPPVTENGSAIAIDYATFLWKTKSDFTRASEYFTDRENQGRNCVVRTDPNVREGLYLVVSIESGETIPDGSTATLEYFRPNKTGAQKAVFALPEWTGSLAGELRIGLTGDAWAKEKSKERPTAWRLSVVDPNGKLLLYRESFLWQHPSKKSAEKNAVPAKTNDAVPAEKSSEETENFDGNDDLPEDDFEIEE